jgi:signal peptidase I
MVLNWFLSRAVRQGDDLRSHVQKLLNEQRDLLPSEAIEAVGRACQELANALAAQRNKAAIHAQMESLIAVADQWIKPYPHGALRENIKDLVVAATVIFGFTTFFLQLTKIPTGSMQPTLYGITGKNLKTDPAFQIPERLTRIAHFWSKGISYYQLTAQEDCTIKEIRPPQMVFPFVKIQRILVGKNWKTIWFPPDKLEERARLREGDTFRKGEEIIRLKVVTGDHLLVDRFTYNFRRPERGEIIVFKTRGISKMEQDQLYIKRLVALGGEKVRIANDQHLIINGQRLDASTPHFENVYTFSAVPQENCYFGHVNQLVASRVGHGYLAPLFENETQELVVGPRHFLALGDNTLNSFDGRSWGAFPQQNVIGKCWFVYWPFTERFGWGNR